MAAHSNILAWEIPWTEEPGRLQPVGSHRVRHECTHNGKLIQITSYTSFCIHSAVVSCFH